MDLNIDFENLLENVVVDKINHKSVIFEYKDSKKRLTTIDLNKIATVKDLILFAEKTLNLEILELKYSGTILLNSRTIRDIFDKDYSRTIVVVNRSLLFRASFIQKEKLETKTFVYEIKKKK